MRRIAPLLVLLLTCKGREPAAPTITKVQRDQVRTTAVARPAGADRLEAQQEVKIVDGEKTPSGQFNECVAVGNDTKFFCTGTLIGKNVILTAAHCHDDGITRVFFGENTNNLAAGRVVKVIDTKSEPRYVKGQPFHDIAVSILQTDITTVTPVPIKSYLDLPPDGRVIIAGFGHTDTSGTSGYGERRFGRINVESCTSTTAPSAGCNADHELLGARFMNQGACGGDSGGPVYHPSRQFIVGSTSRKSGNASLLCGDGAIYERADAYYTFIKGMPGAHW
jgi:secreted trypsin-like serine protease